MVMELSHTLLTKELEGVRLTEVMGDRAAAL